MSGPSDRPGSAGSASPTGGNSPAGPSAGGNGDALRLAGRQYVRFAFYKLDRAWRRLPGNRQAEHKRELADAISSFNRRMLLRPYSLMGTRCDAELLLWQIAQSIEPFQALASSIARTSMGSYLEMTASYLSQTKRSVYEIREPVGGEEERLVISPSEARYLFVYPFLKTRPWYKLPFKERQRMMDEHIRVGRKYPAVKLNTTYSFGLDDQEFVVAFETDEPADFLDLVQELRETDASLYTLRDTPLYTCINLPLEEALDALGGPPIASPREHRVPGDWQAACPVSELPPGSRKVVFLGTQQVVLFNLEGNLYAISNRCSHARGPLSEGRLSPQDCTVTCPWHYAKFDLKTGMVVDGIASSPVASYQVQVRDGTVFIAPAGHRDEPLGNVDPTLTDSHAAG
ncbi:MAG: chlorite dismutase family protein [Phycisphaerae bacterium]|nr:chlorite dismutase family protein [Phycisphaerae bacterium]MDW8261287.1 chlorite dismutase family protein [Phycisphaerales bacterium]